METENNDLDIGGTDLRSSSSEGLVSSDLGQHAIESDPAEETTGSDPNKKLFIFRYRLWMLFLLFIPAAYFAQRYEQVRITYTELKSELINDECIEIGFDKLPDGTQTISGLNVEDAYQSMGVSFDFGLPDHDSNSTEPPAATAVFRVSVLENGNPISKGGNLNQLPSPNYTVFNMGAQKVGAGYIAVFGNFNFPEAVTVTSFKKVGGNIERFKGSITIKFHRPDDVDKPVGVRRVGFHAARLNLSEALEVRLYSPSGKFLCRQSNVSFPEPFMGFESSVPIGRVEIETIGGNQDCAIRGLVFDKIE